jgi:hypothetical protein
MFCDYGPIDAAGSHFSTVGHDQHNVGHDQYMVGRDQHIHFSIAETALHETVQHALRSPPQQQPFSFSSATAVFASHHNHTPCNLASSLVHKIMWLLVDLREFSVNYLYLQELLLKPLHQTLFLTGYALQLYKDTPLGPNLLTIINPEAEKCCLLLRNMLNSINCYRLSLYSTQMAAFWHH